MVLLRLLHGHDYSPHHQRRCQVPQKVRRGLDTLRESRPIPFHSGKSSIALTTSQYVI
jgi:hypothetical protein